MGTFDIIEGDLINMARKNRFGVVAHGCNCFCRQKRGIASAMAAFFGTNEMPLEQHKYYGDINKLGCIDVKHVTTYGDAFYVVNMYTQYHWHEAGHYGIPLDYDALTLCLRKLGHEYADGYIGLPLIGCGLAGGDWTKVEPIIRRELSKCFVTVVKLP